MHTDILVFVQGILRRVALQAMGRGNTFPLTFVQKMDNEGYFKE